MPAGDTYRRDDRDDDNSHRNDGGAQVLQPSDFPLEDSERAVLVRSGGEEPVAWGCWSTAEADASRLMNEIFSLVHGVPEA